MEWKLPSGWCIVKDKREQLVAFSKIIQLLMFLDFLLVVKSLFLAPPLFLSTINFHTTRFRNENPFPSHRRLRTRTHAYHAGCRAWNDLDKESTSLHICRILTTAPLTHSNDACPSVCLPVGDLEMAHCCMPYAPSLSGQDSKPHKRERAKILTVHLSCSERNGPCTVRAPCLWVRERRG